MAQLIVPEDLKVCLSIGLRESYELQIVRGEEQQASNSASILNSGYIPTIELDSEYQFDRDNTSTKYRTSTDLYNHIDNDQYADIGASLSWTLFDGFEVRTNYKRLRELESQSKVETRIAIEDYIATLTAEYYNYIQQHSRLNILNNAVALSKERLRIVRARYVVGNFSRLDYQQANVDFNTDSANYIKQREVLKSSEISLNELMACKDVDAPVSIQDTLITLDTTLNFEELKTAMHKNNLHLLYADHNTQIANLDYKKIISRNYPYVTLNTGYAYNYYNYDRGTTKYTNNLGFQAEVVVGFTIFDTKRRTERRNASIAIANAELNKEDVNLKLRSQLSDLWQAYVNNLGLLELERNNLVSAKINYEIAMDRYMMGTLSGIEMREAQNSLLDAEDRILEATYNTKICEISLLQISGQVTKYLD